MIKKLIILIVAIIATFAYAETLSPVFPFGAISSALLPDPNYAQYLEILLWVGVFYILTDFSFKAAIFLVGGGLSRFGETKPIRRIQGIVAEIGMALLIWLVITVIVTLLSLLAPTENDKIFAEKVEERSKLQRIVDAVDRGEIPTTTIEVLSLEPNGELLVQREKFRLQKEALSLTLEIDALKANNGLAFWYQFGKIFSEYRGYIILFSFGVWIAVRTQCRAWFSKVYSAIRRFFDEGRMGFGGSARFASMFEEWGKAYEAGSIFVGRSLYNPLQEVGLKGDAHMLTVAGSRTGKGVTAIIPNLLLWPHSCVVIDPKGTNAHVTAQARRDMGHDVYLIDPFKIVTDKPDSFDPFADLNPDDDLLRERISSIADAIVIPDTSSKDSHWDDGARTIISGLISHVVGSNKFDPPTLPKIRDLINQLPEDQDKLWAEMSQSTGGGGFARDAAMRYIRGSETNEILNIMSNADKHTEWLSSPAMRRAVTNPTFSLKSLKERPTTVYLIIPPRQVKRQSRLLRLFVNLMIDAIEHGGKSKTPVLMILDEFQNLGVMPEIEDAFATMASYNLVLWPFVQNLSKLQKDYGSVDTFIANSRAVQLFGVSDQETKEYISRRMGNRSLGKALRANDNAPLRTPDDIEKDISKDSGRQYIMEAGKPTLLLEKVPYFDANPLKFIRGFYDHDIVEKLNRFHGKYYPDPDHE